MHNYKQQMEKCSAEEKGAGGKEVALKTSIFCTALTLFPLMLQVWAPAMGSWVMAPAQGCAQPVGCLGA